MSARRASPYVICVNAAGYRASLIPRRLYRVVPDAKAKARGLLRVIDESGEDYLYPAKLFLAVDLPRGATRLLAKTASG